MLIPGGRPGIVAEPADRFFAIRLRDPLEKAYLSG
jgi:hypothetical protein